MQNPSILNATPQPHRGTVALLLLWTLFTSLFLALSMPFLLVIALFLLPQGMIFPQLLFEAGLLTFSLQISGGLLAGFVADRIGRKPVLVTGALLASLGMALLNGSMNLSLFLVAYGVIQLGITSTMVAGLALLFERAQPARRVGALAGYTFLSNLQNVQAILLFSLIESFEFSNSFAIQQVADQHLIHEILWGTAFIGLLGTVGLLFVHDVRPAPLQVPSVIHFRFNDSIRRFFGIMVAFLFVLIAAAIVEHYAVYHIGIQIPFLSSYPAIVISNQGVKFSSTTINASWITNGAFAIGLMLVFLVPFLTRRIKSWQGIALFAGIAIAGVAIFLFAPSLFLIFLGLVVAMGGISSMQVLLSLAILNHAPMHFRGLVSGGMLALSSFATMGSAFLVASVEAFTSSDSFYSPAPYLCAIAMLAVAAIIAVLGLRPSQSLQISPSEEERLAIEVHDL